VAAAYEEEQRRRHGDVEGFAASGPDQPEA